MSSCLKVIVNEESLNFEKTTSSVLSVLLLIHGFVKTNHTILWFIRKVIEIISKLQTNRIYLWTKQKIHLTLLVRICDLAAPLVFILRTSRRKVIDQSPRFKNFGLSRNSLNPTSRPDLRPNSDDSLYHVIDSCKIFGSTLGVRPNENKTDFGWF